MGVDWGDGSGIGAFVYEVFERANPVGVTSG